ncbi:VOC family protein [Fluviibacterium sp. DFM31]|uniref:VOC family protein n=1 Tax=Meridianimarinicoccus marinus TaxID=3231483 RepID=A0ABV3LBM9_9RHOB
MPVAGLHHAAYRCKDAKETVEFYRKYLDLDFNIAVAENEVPSTGEWSPHIHIFLQMPDGSFIAFFELPEDKGNILDPETPAWVQHLALKVENMDVLNAYRDRLEAGGIDVLGPTDHGLCQSIYFRDPSGHRLELVVDTLTQELADRLREKAPEMLQIWSETKRAPDVDLDLHANARG